jgi:DNA-binding CsgD family transcriptional regulator
MQSDQPSVGYDLEGLSATVKNLSEREIEIPSLVATGATNKEIARQLFVRPNTVEVHLRIIFEKAGVRTRTEATLFAIQNRLVQLDDGDVPRTTSDQFFKTATPARTPLAWNGWHIGGSCGVAPGSRLRYCPRLQQSFQHSRIDLPRSAAERIVQSKIMNGHRNGHHKPVAEGWLSTNACFEAQEASKAILGEDLPVSHPVGEEARQENGTSWPRGIGVFSGRSE